MPTAIQLTVILICLLTACGSDRRADPYASPDGGADARVATDASARDGSPDAALGDTPTGSDSGSTTAWCALETCGGNLDGRFEFADPCSLPRPAPFPECRPTQVHSNFRLEGSVQFLAGTARFRTRRVQSSYYWIPAECSRVPCDRAVNFVPPVTGECKAEGEYCDCVSVNEDEWDEETMPYEISGSDLVLAPEDGEPVHFTYCVSGDLLRYVHPETGEATYARRVE